MSNIQELVEQGRVRSIEDDGSGPTNAEDDRLQLIDVTAEFAGRIIIGQEVTIEERAHVGSNVVLEDEAFVGRGAYLGNNVRMESFASIDTKAYVESGVRVGRMAIVGPGSRIAGGVKVPEGADLSKNATIPGPYMIRRYGPVGLNEDFYTVYPGDEVPYICVNGKAETLEEFEQRISTVVPGEIPLADDEAVIIRLIAAEIRRRVGEAVAAGDVERLLERHAAAMGTNAQ